MIGAFNIVANKLVNRLIRGGIIAGLNFASAIWVQRLLTDNLTRQMDTAPKFGPVILMAHIVEANLGGAVMPVVTDTHMPARFGAHRTDMQLEPVPFGRGLTIIADRHRQEVVLDIRIGDTGSRANEAKGLKLV